MQGRYRGDTVLLHELRERDGDDGVRARGGRVHQRRAHGPVGVAHILHLVGVGVRARGKVTPSPTPTPTPTPRA